MKHIKKFNENTDDQDFEISNKVSELSDKLNEIDDLDVTIQHKEDGGNILLRIELTLNRNLKKLTPESLTVILKELKGSYIENINYVEKDNKMVITIKTFKNKL